MELAHGVHISLFGEIRRQLILPLHLFVQQRYSAAVVDRQITLLALITGNTGQGEVHPLHISGLGNPGYVAQTAGVKGIQSAANQRHGHHKGGNGDPESAEAPGDDHLEHRMGHDCANDNAGEISGVVVQKGSNHQTQAQAAADGHQAAHCATGSGEGEGVLCALALPAAVVEHGQRQQQQGKAHPPDHKLHRNVVDYPIRLHAVTPVLYAGEHIVDAVGDDAVHRKVGAQRGVQGHGQHGDIARQESGHSEVGNRADYRPAQRHRRNGQEPVQQVAADHHKEHGEGHAGRHGQRHQAERLPEQGGTAGYSADSIRHADHLSQANRHRQGQQHGNQSCCIRSHKQRGAPDGQGVEQIYAAAAVHIAEVSGTPHQQE